MPSSKRLLFSVTKKDLKIEKFRAGGSGGQHQNKKDTGVRVTHPESGAVGEGRDTRSQKQNLKNAFLRMTKDNRFVEWLDRKTKITIPETRSTRRYTYKEPDISFEGRKLDRE